MDWCKTENFSLKNLRNENALELVPHFTWNIFYIFGMCFGINSLPITIESCLSKNKNKYITTISEFVDGTALDATIISNCLKYRAKFLNIIEKSGVGDSNTKDQQAINKILITHSWNWAAFFFHAYWLIYRKEKSLGWILFITTHLVFGPLAPILCPIVIGVEVGMYGSSYVFRNSIQTYENTTSSKDRDQRSPTGLAVAIGIDIVIIGILLISEGII